VKNDEERTPDKVTCTVGLIGLGNMGLPIASRVARSGLSTVVYDMREEPVTALRDLGARVATSPANLAEQCDVICVILNNDAQLRSVMLGSGGDGLLDHTWPGAVVAIHSTVSPLLCHELAEYAAGRGVAVIDAPVSGSEFGARDGTLSLMVGGDAQALEKCRPVLESFSANIFHLGVVGTGQIAKLANNLMVAVNTHAVFEGLTLAAAAGIDHHKMIEVAKASSGDSYALRSYEYFIDMAERYLGGLAAFQDTIAKDLRHAIEVADEYAISLPTTSSALAGARQFWTLP